MATTCTLTLNSDMLSSPISISAPTELKKAATTDDLELIEMGKGTISEADGSKTAEFGLPTALGADKAAKLFFVNKATDPTFYIDIDLHDTNVGRLYAGDWMFMPWDSDVVAVGAGGSAIEIQAYVAEAEIEYCLFHNGETKVTSDDS